MDKIIGYSDDELVVRILSFLPTKVAVSTSVLSKHWKFLWMRVTKLDYDDTLIKDNRSKSERMRRFIAMNLTLHSSPFIESLCLDLRPPSFQPGDIRSWVGIAVSRCVRELSIRYLEPYYSCKRNAILPSSLYTCKSLVTLKLNEMILVDVPRVVSLPSLKTLHLRSVIYADEESLQRLLSNCSVLEDLIVEQYAHDYVRKFAVIIPSLLSLSVEVCSCDEYEIDTPSLKYFKVRDFSESSSSCLIMYMPKLEEADISLFGFSDVKKLLEPITSVKRLSLSLKDNNVEAVYGDDIVFHELEHLKFNIGNSYWSNLLLSLLKGSPKLRDFDFYANGVRDGMDTSVCWKQLVYVPRCLLSSLQTFKWTNYDPTTGERDLATYILRSSCRLKTARILIGSWLDPQKKLEMKNELVISCRGSTTCNLVLDNY